MKGYLLKEESYEEGVNKYINGIDHLVKCSSPKFWQITNELSHLLRKLCFGESFSQITKGGTAQHNINLIPIYMQLISHTILTENDFKQLEEIADMIKKEDLNCQEFFLVSTCILLTKGKSEWASLRNHYLKVVANFRNEKTETNYSSLSKEFYDVQPFLIDFLITNYLFNHLDFSENSQSLKETSTKFTSDLISLYRKVETFADFYKRLVSQESNFLSVINDILTTEEILILKSFKV